MTNSHQRIFCYLPGVKKIRCTCIQPHVYLGVWHFYAALSFSNDCHQLKLCSPLKAQFQCHLYREPCRDPLKCKLLLIPLHSLSTFVFFFFFLVQHKNRPSLELYPLSRRSCSNLLTLKQTGSLFCIYIGLQAHGKRRAISLQNLMEKQIKFLALRPVKS